MYHPQHSGQVSPGKNDNFHPIYLLHLLHKLRAVLDFALFGKLVRLMQPLMQFLFVRPGLCLRLLSDSQSPTTPLPLANDSYCQVHSGLTPPSYRPCRAHCKRGRPIAYPAHAFLDPTVLLNAPFSPEESSMSHRGLKAASPSANRAAASG